MESFKKLGLAEELLKAVADAHFTEPTEIQEKAIPLALAGKDVIGSAMTGSGKTLAFGASIIQHLPRKQGIQALILTPTRELAEQNGKSLRAFSKYKQLEIAIVYGGVAMSPQVNALETADAVVGTPGRILDHLRQGTLKLDKVKVLVLDEADRMLDMGFIEDVDAIISQCPKERQTFLFSATITPDITQMAKKYMKHPEEVSAESYVDPSLLQQVFYDAPQDMKFSLLVHLLKNEKVDLVMVFCNTRRNADFVAHNLQREGVDATAIHGGLTQARRNKIMEHFRKGHVVVLVCTDVAARGLDIKGISHVYNYDTPPGSKEYIHRIGRTARAGKEGKAISIVASRDYENFRNVMRDDSLKIAQEQLPADVRPLRVSLQYDARSEGRGFGGRGFRGRGGRFGDRGGGRGFGGRFSSRGEERRGGFGSREGRFGGDRGRGGFRPRTSEGGFRQRGQFGSGREGFGGRGHFSSGRSHEGGERRSFGPRRFGSGGGQRFGSRGGRFGSRDGGRSFGPRRFSGPRGSGSGGERRHSGGGADREQRSMEHLERKYRYRG